MGSLHNILLGRKIIKLNSPIWILHRWRASRFLVINRKPIDITKHQQNALQFIELHRTLRESLANEQNIITADINVRYRQPLIH